MSNINEIYWVIRIINVNGLKGYITETNTGIHITDAHAGVTKFTDLKKANCYIGTNRLNREGVTSVPITNAEMAIIEKTSSKYLQKTQVNHYYITNNEGKKLCYDLKKDKYHFSEVQIGYSEWHNISDVITLINYLSGSNEEITEQDREKLNNIAQTGKAHYQGYTICTLKKM